MPVAPAPSDRDAAIELLRQHASLLLMKMSVQEGRFGELRDIAVTITSAGRGDQA